MPGSILSGGSGYSFPDSGGGGGGSGVNPGAVTVLVATQANIASLAGGAPLTVDGIGLSAGDLVLVKAQGTATENGIYSVSDAGTGADGTWVRAVNADAGAKLEAIGLVYVDEGTVDEDTLYKSTTTPPITLGATAITYVPFTVGLSGKGTLLFGANAVSSTTATRYLFPSFDNGLAQTVVIQVPVPFSGTISNLYLRHNAPSGNGNDIVYTLRVNGVTTALTVTLASTAPAGTDLASSVAVVAGDLIDIEVTKAVGIGSSPNDIIASMQFTPA